MPADAIELDSDWGFKVSKNEEEQTCLQFKTHDGTEKRSTPTFLMALLIKEHLKAIKAAGGAIPTKLGFHLFEDFDREAETRIESQLMEACKSFNIEFNFVKLI